MRELDRRIIRLVELLPPSPCFSPGDKARILLTLCGEKPVTMCGSYPRTDYKESLSMIRQTGLLTVVESFPADKEYVFIFCSSNHDYLREMVMAYRSGDEETKGRLYGYPITAVEAFVHGLHGGILRCESWCAFCYIRLSHLEWKEEMSTIRKWCQIVKELSPFIWQQCLRMQAAIIDSEDLGKGMSRAKTACDRCPNNLTFE